MSKTRSCHRASVAVRARAIVQSRAERPLFLGLLGVLLLLWACGLVAVGNGLGTGHRQGAFAPSISLVSTETAAGEDPAPGRHI